MYIITYYRGKYNEVNCSVSKNPKKTVCLYYYFYCRYTLTFYRKDSYSQFWLASFELLCLFPSTMHMKFQLNHTENKANIKTSYCYTLMLCHLFAGAVFTPDVWTIHDSQKRFEIWITQQISEGNLSLLSFYKLIGLLHNSLRFSKEIRTIPSIA